MPPEVFRLAQLRFVLLEKIADRRARIHVEIAFIAIPAQRIIDVAQQHVVAVRNAVPAPIQIEIHIETGFQRFVRASPFRHERGFWKFRTNLGKHVLPSANRERFAGVVLLDETVCHVNAVRAKRDQNLITSTIASQVAIASGPNAGFCHARWGCAKP